jgi:hypothetical protein
METLNRPGAEIKISPKKLSFYRCDDKGIPLSFLIQAHCKYDSDKKSSARILKENIGDAFLYHENPIFRNIRDEYLKRGFSFSATDFCDYNAFPFMALDELIDAGKIPYLRNFRWIKRLHESCRGKLSCSELQYLNINYNYLLHESAHFIGHDVFFGRDSLNQITKTVETLLQVLVCESYANTAEAIALVFAKGAFGPYFLRANSYIFYPKEKLALLLSFVEKYGHSSTTRIYFASQLYANFLYNFLDVSEIEKICAFAGLECISEVETLARIFINSSAGSSVVFRTKTTPFHLLKIGFDYDLLNSIDRDPLDFINEPGLECIRQKIDQLLGILERI